MTEPTVRIITAALDAADVDTDERTLAGVITEYGAIGYTSAGPTRWDAGSLRTLEGERAVKLLEQHDTYAAGLGYMTGFADDPTLPRGTFYVAPDSAGRGDAALEAAQLGTRDALSVGVQIEEAYIDDDGVLVVTAGVIYEVSLVTIPAFFNARLDTAAVSAARAALAPVLQTTAPAPAESVIAGRPATNPEETIVPTAVAPNTVAEQASQEQIEAAERLGANAVFAAMTTVMNGHNPKEREEAERLLAQLSDIKFDGDGALPADGVLQADWVGEAWRGRAYQRKYITLGTQGPIRAMKAKGFVLDQGTALVKEWAGNKTELPTGEASTSLVESVLTRFGFAADIAREFFDLPGGEEVVAAFWRGVIESYARITDRKALAQIVAAAGNSIAADTFPTDYPPALGMLLQGIEHIEDGEDTPTFAIMNKLAWRQALYAGKDKLPEFVKFDFGTQGEGVADGFRVVRGDIGLADRPAVLVGSKQGIRFNELGETPVTFDALDVARGGIDRATVGYLQTLVERKASFVRIAMPAPAGQGA